MCRRKRDKLVKFYDEFLDIPIGIDFIFSHANYEWCAFDCLRESIINNSMVDSIFTANESITNPHVFNSLPNVHRNREDNK